MGPSESINPTGLPSFHQIPTYNLEARNGSKLPDLSLYC